MRLIITIITLLTSMGLSAQTFDFSCPITAQVALTEVNNYLSDNNWKQPQNNGWFKGVKSWCYEDDDNLAKCNQNGFPWSAEYELYMNYTCTLYCEDWTVNINSVYDYSQYPSDYKSYTSVWSWDRSLSVDENISSLDEVLTFIYNQ